MLKAVIPRVPPTSTTSGEFAYQLDSNGHRGTPAIQQLVEYAPASGGLALWMQHRNVDAMPSQSIFSNADQRQKPWIIGNDGTTLYYGPAFTNRSLKEQAGLVAHQVLHVALRHVDREHVLRNRLGDIDAELYAVCADAIVNSSLSHLSWLELPKGSVTLDTLLLNVLGIEQAVDVSLHEWNTESLYRAIDDRTKQSRTNSAPSNKNSETGSSGKSLNHGEASGKTEESHVDTQEKAQNQAENEAQQSSSKNGNPSKTSTKDDGPKASAARQLASTIIRDLLPASSTTPESRDQSSLQWRDRLLKAHAADEQQSFMRQLLADNSLSKTPWEQILRTRLQRALSLKPETNWSRPTRSWIANQGRTSNGHRMPWEPGTSYSRSAPRLCIMVDVSGSVPNDLLHRFANEIDRMVRTLAVDALLIIGDDAVREQYLLKSGVSRLRDIQFTGGGATNFVPLLKAADVFNPDIGVYLTDLEGPAGDPPRWPVVWAVPADARAQPVPFGLRLLMD